MRHYNGRVPAHQRWTVDPDWLAKLIIVVLSISGPAFLEDDASYFSYLNNVLHPAPLYYVNGFVYVIPELAAYAWSFFPLAMQGPLYRVLPLLMSLAIYGEFRRLFNTDTERTNAVLLAFSAIMIMRVVEPDLWADLGFLHYACYVWAVLRLVRMDRDAAALSGLTFFCLLVAAVSFPLGLLFAPVLLFQAARGGTDGSRRQRQALALAIVVFHVAFAARAGGIPVRFERPDQLAIAFFANFREHKMHNLVVVLSAIVLTALAVRPITRLRSGTGRVEMLTLWFLGIASVVAYFYSDRFRQNRGGFEPNHVVPILTCAVAAIGQMILRSGNDRTRTGLVGGAFGFAAAMLTVALYTTLRGPLELSLMKYRFLSVAEDFRRHCRDGEAMVFEDDGRSPVVLCRPREFGVGFHPVRVPPSVGFFDPASDDPPGISVEPPLF